MVGRVPGARSCHCGRFALTSLIFHAAALTACWMLVPKPAQQCVHSYDKPSACTLTLSWLFPMAGCSHMTVLLLFSTTERLA